MSSFLCHDSYVDKSAKPTLSDLLKAARDERDLSQRDVAKLAKMHLTSYQRLETGESQLLSEHAGPLSKAIGIPLLDLLGIVESSSFVSSSVNKKSIPRLEYAEAAKLADTNITLNNLSVVETIPLQGERGTMVFALRIEDDSMAPRFNRGDILIFDLDKREKINPGSVVASALNHGQTVIGTYHQKRPGFEIHPVNHAYPSYDSSRDVLTIIGTAVKLVQNLD